MARHDLLSSVRRWSILLISLGALITIILLAGPTEILNTFRRVSWLLVAAILCLLFMSLFVVAFRLWRVLLHLGLKLPWMTALRASMVGNVGSLFFISLLGQVAGRQAILQGAGVSATANASIAAYERFTLAFTSGGLAFFGAFYLLGRDEIMHFLSNLSLGQITMAALVGYGVSYALGRGRIERGLRDSLFRRQNLLRLLEVLFITVMGQALMLACFILAFNAVAPQLNLISLIAASAIVSFAASLPISVSGWGVRELVAVHVLGSLGVSAADALVGSVLVGICSTMALVGAVPFLWGGRLKQMESKEKVPETQGKNLAQTATWMLGFCGLIAVFFQVHVPLSEGVVNINLADPFAVLALASVVLQCFQQRAFPSWRMVDLNRALLLISVALCVAFIVGWHHVGVTQWALGARLMGWLVLLGYLSIGYILTSTFGPHGIRRASETLLSVACAIVLIGIISRLMLGLSGNEAVLKTNFEGYAANRNAFAFQLLAVSALVLGYSGLYTRRQWSSLFALMLAFMQGLALVGIVLSGSRAGMGTAAIMLLVAWIGKFASRRFIATSMITGLCLYVVVVFLPPVMNHIIDVWNTYLSTDIGSRVPLEGHFLQSHFSTEDSDGVRWRANLKALEMWLENPFLGGGLGVFIALSPQVFGFPLVIHSTPLWILAEFGLVGIGLIGWAGWLVARFALCRWPTASKDKSLILMLVAFSIFCVVHEVLFQRIFWLILGLLLAVPRMDLAALRKREVP